MDEITYTVAKCRSNWPDCTAPWYLRDTTNVDDHRGRHYATKEEAEEALTDILDFEEYYSE